MKKIVAMFVALTFFFGIAICGFAQKAKKAAVKKEGQKIEVKNPPAPAITKKEEAVAAKSRTVPKTQKGTGIKTKKNIKVKSNVTSKRSKR